MSANDELEKMLVAMIRDAFYAGVEEGKKGSDSAELDMRQALREVATYVAQAERKARIDELLKFDIHGLTVMDNSGEIDYVHDRITHLGSERIKAELERESE